MSKMKKENNVSRRTFLSTGAVVATGAAAAGLNIKGSDELSQPEVIQEELQELAMLRKKV